jgi:hypothetical protein
VKMTNGLSTFVRAWARVRAAIEGRI